MLKNLYWKIIHSKFGMFVVFSIKPVIEQLTNSLSKIENSNYHLTYFGEYGDLRSKITVLESENEASMKAHLMYIKSLENDFRLGGKKKLSVSNYPTKIDQNLKEIAILEERIRKRSKIIERKDVKLLRLTLSYIFILIPMIIGLTITSYLKAFTSLSSNNKKEISKLNSNTNQKSDDDLPF